ncbi:hypothetical protein RKD23_003202 [Streptomyces sp. SAI-170]|uniref:hypothetical protein n=1 Tax=Streptomyces sp. SAI-170 TaxID=3377729 RepID=UPI003C7BCC19
MTSLDFAEHALGIERVETSHEDVPVDRSTEKDVRRPPRTREEARRQVGHIIATEPVPGGVRHD